MERVPEAGLQLMQALEPLRRHPCVGDLRGMGLLVGIEWVRDAATREPWPPEVRFANRAYDAALGVPLRRDANLGHNMKVDGVLTYPVQGCMDGLRSDITLLAPPYIISLPEMEEIVNALEAAILRVTGELQRESIS